MHKGIRKRFFNLILHLILFSLQNETKGAIA